MTLLPAEHAQAVHELCQRFRVESLYIFGSAVTSDFDHARSDLDFLVRFAPAAPRDHADQYFGLLEALRDLFGRQIDLVEEEAIRNPYLLRSITASRQLVYEAA
ncbi:MAG: nucleotidyltransferase domain-containing protein [Acidobacteria bacterium]|nr:nucleotidyltransferase domain-containing protein [Acidobacteriota bacterium]